MNIKLIEEGETINDEKRSLKLCISLPQQSWENLQRNSRSHGWIANEKTSTASRRKGPTFCTATGFGAAHEENNPKDETINVGRIYRPPTKTNEECCRNSMCTVTNNSKPKHTRG